MIDECRLAHARSACQFSALAQSISEAFLQEYLDGPPESAVSLYRGAYVRASERMLAAPEGSREARQARREMELHRGALRALEESCVSSRAGKKRAAQLTDEFFTVADPA